MLAAMEWVTCFRLLLDWVVCLCCSDVWVLPQTSTMPPRRRVPTRLHPSSSDEPEQQASGQDWQDEVSELRTEVAQLLSPPSGREKH